MSLTLDIDGPAAPPRANGELVFDEPWESRSFAMVAALVDAGHFSWDEFRDHLIAAVQRWQATPGDDYRYYERWQEALEAIVAQHRIVLRRNWMTWRLCSRTVQPVTTTIKTTITTTTITTTTITTTTITTTTDTPTTASVTAMVAQSRSVTADWHGGYRCDVSAGEFVIAVDEPSQYGGTDEGPQPTELLLGAAASCFVLALSHSARKRGIELAHLRVKATGVYDGPRFKSIDLAVDIGCDEAHRPKLMEAATRICYVTNTLRSSPDIKVRSI